MAMQPSYQDEQQQEGAEYLQDDNYDFGVSGADIDETDTFAPIPGGRYNLMAVSCELKDSKGGKMVAVEFQVVDGEHSGRKVFENYNLQHTNPQTVEIAQRQVKQWMIAAGVDPNQRLTMGLFKMLEGMEFNAQVGIEADKTGRYGDRNRIRKYEPASQPAEQRSAPPASTTPPRRTPPAGGPATTPRRPPAAAGGKKPWEK